MESGEVVGFLGPNGAGKTTTLRMLTCFLPPTSGTAEIEGHDILDDPLGVRRLIGYLPESVPLYRDMRVDEYLRFRARIKGVPRNRIASRMTRVSAQCRIGDVRSRIIGHLSKGFRQRVGMADALIHDPPILLFDEPTSGLDPNQIREVRDLIAELALEKTLLISTHILPEVEATCDRVIIIHKGRVVTDGRIDDLREGASGESLLRCRGLGEPVAGMTKALGRLEGVVSVREDRNDGLVLTVTKGANVPQAVSRLFAEKGWELTELRTDRKRLEEVFWRVTGFEVGSREKKQEGAENEKMEKKDAGKGGEV
jgi:ABC-2 type transport system ATP-binding protein